MIGSGWLFSAFYASSMSGPLTIIAWIIGALIITTIALVYAKLSLRIPTTGATAFFSKIHSWETNYCAERVVFIYGICFDTTS